MFDQAAGKPKSEKTICPNEVPPSSLESSRPKGSHGVLRLGYFYFGLTPEITGGFSRPVDCLVG